MRRKQVHRNLGDLDRERCNEQRPRGPAGRQAQNGSRYRWEFGCLRFHDLTHLISPVVRPRYQAPI